MQVLYGVLSVEPEESDMRVQPLEIPAGQDVEQFWQPPAKKSPPVLEDYFYRRRNVLVLIYLITKAEPESILLHHS